VDEHYKIFYFPKCVPSTKKKIKELYLTYLGILFASHKVTAEKFVNWATKTLFTAQMGTLSEKTKLAGNILGVSPKAVKEVFNKTAKKIPCIYLFSIGKVKDLRKTLKIEKRYEDEDYVYKWGMSEDLERRTKEHEKTYGKMKGVLLELVLFAMIDQQYISEAETKIKHFFEDSEMKINNSIYKELAVIPKNKMRLIKGQYEMVSTMYLGHISELINKIKEKDNEIKIIKNECENKILKMENEIMKKENE